MAIKIHKAFGKKDLVDGNWYKVRAGICSAEYMIAKDFLFGKKGFVRLNTMDYKMVKRDEFIDCYGEDSIAGFSHKGEILIDPDDEKYEWFAVKQDKIIKFSENKPGGEVLINQDMLYDSLLEEISKTREVKFVN